MSNTTFKYPLDSKTLHEIPPYKYIFQQPTIITFEGYKLDILPLKNKVLIPEDSVTNPSVESKSTDLSVILFLLSAGHKIILNCSMTEKFAEDLNNFIDKYKIAGDKCTGRFEIIPNCPNNDKLDKLKNNIIKRKLSNDKLKISTVK